MSDIINLNLSELVSNIKDKKISSNEVANAYIERSKKSKSLNVYNEETFDTALKKLPSLTQNLILIKSYLVYQLL